MNSPFTEFAGSDINELQEPPVYNETDFESPFTSNEFMDSETDGAFETDETDFESDLFAPEPVESSESHEPWNETGTIKNEVDYYLGNDLESGQELEESFTEERPVESEFETKLPGGDLSILSVERDRMGTTIYINPDLKINNTSNITGIFIPGSFVPSDNFEMIIYLHGYKYDTMKGPTVCYQDICPCTTIQSYWKSSLFLLREALYDSGRNCILVAPTLGLRSEAGTLQMDRGFDLFINQVLRSLQSEKIFEASYRPARIILAAHSGGGGPMQRITMLNDRYSKLVKECWCFDALYGKVATYWWQWIKAEKDRKLFSYYYGSAPTKQSNDIAVHFANMPGRFIKVESRIRDHWKLVLPYWRERCKPHQIVNETYEQAEEEFRPFEPEDHELDSFEMETIAPDNPVSKYHSSKLPADPDPNLDAFKRKVYDRCIASSKARAKKDGRDFLDDLPNYTSFPKLDGEWVHPRMLEPLKNLMAQAFAAASARGDSIRLKVASGYRPTSLQFARWNGLFYKYYQRAVQGYTVEARGEKKYNEPILSSNDFSDKAAQRLATIIGGLYASPGYSNHNNGRAVDFALSGSERRKNMTYSINLGPNSSQIALWRDTNLWHWLKDNANALGFKEYWREPWHWDFIGWKMTENETEFREEIIFPQTEEPLELHELLEEGVVQYETKPKSKKRSIILGPKDPPLYYVGIDVTDTVDTVAFGHLWNQKFGWSNLLWELDKDPSNNQRRVDKAHPKLPIVRLVRKLDGDTYSDTCLVPQGVDGKGTDKLWGGSSSVSNQSEIDAACAFMQSFILNPSADKSTSSLNDSGTGVTADIVYISSHGLSNGDMFGETGFSDLVFALSKSVSLGAQFSGVGWLLLSNCSTLKSYTHEDWLKIMSGPNPLRGIVGFQDTCPLAPGSVKVFQSFIKRLGEDKTFIKSWSEALKVRGLEDHWIVVCQENAVNDKITDFNARTLTPISSGGKILMFNKANPTGVQVVPVPDPFEVFWTKAGTKITPANRGVAANKLSVGDKLSITVRPPAPMTAFSNGTNISITVVYVRLDYPHAIDITKIFKLTGYSGIVKPTTSDLNPKNPPGPDSWEVVVSGNQKEIILNLECADLTGLNSNYIFWLEVKIPGTTHEFVHNGSIVIR